VPKAPRYILTIRPLPDPLGRSPAYRLKLALKYLLRACHLQCTVAKEKT
jgi:hypothetical protein